MPAMQVRGRRQEMPCPTAELRTSIGTAGPPLLPEEWIRMMLEITPYFIGVFAVMQVPITGLVGYRRFQTRIPFLDGGDRTLMRRMRAHGNFTETVPMSLLAMAAAELTGAPHWLIWGGGVVLLAGRLMHFTTLLRSEWGIGRAIGIIFTLISMGGFGLLALAGMLSLR